MSSGSALVLQLLRAHYRRDDMAVAGAAAMLMRAASPAIKPQIQEIIRKGYQGRGPTPPGGFEGDRYRRPDALKDLKPQAPIGPLQPMRRIGFPELMLEPDLQALLDELVQELEFREELAERNLRARNRFLFHGPPGNGKCLQIGTLVMRFDGSLATVEAVRAGDLLMGPDSKPRRVLSTTAGTGPLYRVHPVKGDPWVRCCAASAFRASSRTLIQTVSKWRSID